MKRIGNTLIADDGCYLINGDEIAETVVKPSLESYNNSVYEFIKLNDHINSLRKRENKTLILALYKYLAKLENDKEKVLKIAKDSSKINGEWNYILALFYVKLNTLVSVKLVESEDSTVIYHFLSESLRNQKKLS